MQVSQLKRNNFISEHLCTYGCGEVLLAVVCGYCGFSMDAHDDLKRHSCNSISTKKKKSGEPAPAPTNPPGPETREKKKQKMEDAGIDPATSRMLSERSTI